MKPRYHDPRMVSWSVRAQRQKAPPTLPAGKAAARAQKAMTKGVLKTPR